MTAVRACTFHCDNLPRMELLAKEIYQNRTIEIYEDDLGEYRIYIDRSDVTDIVGMMGVEPDTLVDTAKEFIDDGMV